MSKLNFPFQDHVVTPRAKPLSYMTFCVPLADDDEAKEAVVVSIIISVVAAKVARRAVGLPLFAAVVAVAVIRNSSR